MRRGYSRHSYQVGRRTTVGSVALALMLLATVVLLPNTEGRAATADQITFEGGGFGHSVGMSQFGAYGMALEGATWQEIITHYFTGTTVGDLDPEIAAEPIWVGLQQERTQYRLTVFRTWAGSAEPVVFTLGDAAVIATVGQTVTITDLGSGWCRVTAPSGTLEGPCRIDATWDGWDTVPSVGLQIEGCSLPDWNAEGGVVYRPCQYARGDIHIRPDNGAGLNISVEIDIEDYLLGISEMPYFWGEVGGAAALEAQAVAARSYALHRAIVRGDAENRPWCSCDIYDTTVDQFYVGWGHGQTAWINAVRATTGKVAYHPFSTWGDEMIPIEAFYSSSTFGSTENSEHGFRAAIPYLRSVDDHWSVLPEVGNRHGRWTRDYTGDELATLLPGVSSVTSAEITACSATGAALEITFAGSHGSKAFPTRDLRTLLGLRSMQVYNIGAPPPEVPPCSGPGLSPLPEGGPLVLASLSIDDDNIEDSAGNGDGIAACGEDIEVYTTFRNEGESVIDLKATISTRDPYLGIMWNIGSAMDDITAGALGTHSGDWDFRISPHAPDGYAATFQVTVEADNGGPWTMDAQIPVACPGPEVAPAEEIVTTTTTTTTVPPTTTTTVPPTTTTTTVPVVPIEPVEQTPELATGTALASIPDVSGDGVTDTAVAAVGDDGLAHLIVTAGDAVHVDVVVKEGSFVPRDVVEIGDIGGSPAADVVVLLNRADDYDFFVTVDTGTGEILNERRLNVRYAWLDIEVFDRGAETGAPTVALLSALPGASNRVLLFNAATGKRLDIFKLASRMTPIDLEVLPDYLGGSLPELAVIGRLENRRVDLQVIDASRVTAERLVVNRNIKVRDLEPAYLGEDYPQVAILRRSGGNIHVDFVDLVARSRVSTLQLPLVDAYEAESITAFGDHGNPVVAVMGTADDGSTTVAVVDGAGGGLLAGPLFPFGAADLDPIEGTTDLAVLFNDPDGKVGLAVRESLSGDVVADREIDGTPGS